MSSVVTMAENAGEHLASLYQQHKIALEIAWTIIAYSFWIPRMRKTALNPGYTKVVKLNRNVMYFHTAFSFAELILYYTALAREQTPPAPTPLMIALCVGQSLTSLWTTSLIHNVPRGHLESTRVTFQCMSLQRLIAAGIACWTGCPFWHRVSIKLLNNFMWTRPILLWLPHYIAGLHNGYQVYTNGIIAGHFLAMWEAGFPNGPAVFIGLAYFLLFIDRVHQNRTDTAASLLTTMGFVTRPKVAKEEPKANGNTSEKSGEPQEKSLMEMFMD